MLDLLAEGVESLRLPCSWVLLIPALGVTFFGRRRPVLVVAVFVSAVGLVAWLRFAGWWFSVPDGLLQVLLGVVMIAGAAVAWRTDRASTDSAAAGFAGATATWAWIPCVGPHLGDLINGAGSDPFDHIGGTVSYVAGLLLPFILVAALGASFPSVRGRLDDDRLIAVGGVVLLVFGALFATTTFDDIASELARRSSF